MDSFVNKLKELANEFPLEKSKWDIPNNCLIEFPSYCKCGYSKNIYLKENFQNIIANDPTLESHYWAIRDWGGIRSFKRTENNNCKIQKFLEQLNKKGELTKKTFECISSLSKVASFVNPDKYAIYDSRAIYALNWLLFNYSSSSKLFPQPNGRSAKLSRYDMQTIFSLSKRTLSYWSYKVAFYEYCDLLNKLSLQVYGENRKPYKVEMLLFMVAPTIIVSQIESAVSLTIDI